MKKYITRKRLVFLFLLFVLLLMLFYPEEAFLGASRGLSLWALKLVPTLLPFMIASDILLSLRMTNPINRLVAPLVTKLFPIGKTGCYPLLIGLFCGLPLGAKLTAELYQNHQLSYREAMFLLCFCNQPSFMFLYSFLAFQCLHNQVSLAVILLFLYGNAYLISWIYYIFTKHISTASVQQMSTQQTSTTRTPHNPKRLSPAVPSFLSALDNAIVSSIATITRIGGYIVLFSMMIIFVEMLPLPTNINATISCFLEISSGIQNISASALTDRVKITLVLMTTAFGGLSAFMQTVSVTRNSGLSMRSYLTVKLIQGINCGIAVFFFLA